MTIISITGVVCIILGFISIVAGIGGGIRTMIKNLKSDEAQSYSLETTGNLIIELIKAITAFLEALKASPVWLAISILGFILLGGGVYLFSLGNGLLPSLVV